MRSCPSCGREVRSQARFCPRCGVALVGSLPPPDQLERAGYTIVRSLTKGGMGAVYLAKDKRAFDRLCVVKQMLEYYDPADPEERRRAQQRFEEEGRTLASLSHPGIPQIYAFFSENGRYYLVMEYIQGENLETFVTHEDETGATVPGQRLPLEEIGRYTVQVCRILEYLHAQQRPVVHQDVKPANLILERQRGEVRLVDFGTARAKIPPGAEPGNGEHASVYGTDGYAPPEQYRGNPVPRSDVFALAATAYHLLTDDDPRKHPFKFPRLDDLPRELGLALKRALRSAPDRRSTARELHEMLESMVAPGRALEAFTFPGGTRIRSVGSLPALSDDHWDAARSYLYNGDFQRWLRDLNRHDLVAAADEIVHREKNHDAGLEAFLHVVDPGLSQPRLTCDPSEVDLGPIARQSALIRKITVSNTARGYALAQVSATQPWIEVYPTSLHLWTGMPADIRVSVRAEDLPLRSKQRGQVIVQSDGHDPIEIPVTAQISLVREIWRIIRRAVGAALPESWHTVRRGWRIVSRGADVLGSPFLGRPWLLPLAWLLVGVAIGAGLYFSPYEALTLGKYTYAKPVLWFDYVLPVLLGPPLIISIGWLAFLLIMLVGGALFGAAKGAWKSFYR